MSAYEYNATVVRVVDGDTIDLRVDLGFHMFASIRFRLAGVDTPEVRGASREAGLAAKQFVIDMLGQGDDPADCVGAHCTVQSRRTGKFGRWLGVIWNERGQEINGRLLLEGHAKPYHGGKR